MLLIITHQVATIPKKYLCGPGVLLKPLPLRENSPIKQKHMPIASKSMRERSGPESISLPPKLQLSWLTLVSVLFAFQG